MARKKTILAAVKVFQFLLSLKELFQNGAFGVCGICSWEEIVQPLFYPESLNVEWQLMSAKSREVSTATLPLFLMYFLKIWLPLWTLIFLKNKIWCFKKNLFFSKTITSWRRTT